MISSRKVTKEKERIIRNCKSCSGTGCPVCFGYTNFIDQMVGAEIPVDYWFRSMDNFYGEENFHKFISNYIDSIDDNFAYGRTLCLVGHRGTGKTMAACSILKAALLKKYECYYTTAVDIIGQITSGHYMRSVLKNVDFFVIDEVDQRFFPTENSRELFGNVFENILRTRAQNLLPTIMCTNSEDINQIFSGEFNVSFESLKSQFIKVVRAGGKDARKGKEKI